MLVFFVVCSFITPLNVHRKIASTILGDCYFETYIECSLDVCEKRDVKGLYKKARNGIIKNFTGIHDVYEVPKNPNIVLKTELNTVEQCVEMMFNKL